MKQLTFFALEQEASGNFLTERYPDDWNDLTEAEQMEFISDHAWEPFECWQASEVQSAIDDAARGMEYLLATYNIGVQS
jgi:hypothetical protein